MRSMGRHYKQRKKALSMKVVKGWMTVTMMGTCKYQKGAFKRPDIHMIPQEDAIP